MYDLRQISNYVHSIHSRYWIDTNGSVYTSIQNGNYRIMINGNLKNVRCFVNENLSKTNTSDRQILPIEGCENYFLKNDGNVLKRLATRVDTIGVVDVCLTTLMGRDKGDRFRIHRLMGYVFMGLKEGQEVHHKDQDRKNNKLGNLECLSFDQHRGKNHFTSNHNL